MEMDGDEWPKRFGSVGLVREHLRIRGIRSYAVEHHDMLVSIPVSWAKG